MTIHQIDMTRKHAATYRYLPGHYVAPPTIVRVRISKGKIQHFIEFISAPQSGFWFQTLEALVRIGNQNA